MKEFTIAMLQNPEIFKDNNIPAHSDHVFYRSMEEMEQERSSFYFSLDGSWKFHYAKNYDSTISTVMCGKWIARSRAHCAGL